MQKMNTRITPEYRVSQYPDEFEALNGILICCWCNKAVDYSYLDQIKAHVVSKKHNEFKLANNKKRQSNLNSYSSKMPNKEAIHDFIKMMCCCSIPLEKVDKMKPWLEKYMSNSGAIPNSKVLRDYHLSIVSKKEKDDLIAMTKKVNFSIGIDGTKDHLGRTIVNSVLFFINGITKLGICKILEKENGTTL